jgi:hypothetical protein
MKLWLTRQHNGLYMLTAMKPIFAKVEGRDFEDAYVAPGEPVGMRNFCDLILKLVKLEQPLKRGEMIQIHLEGYVDQG